MRVIMRLRRNNFNDVRSTLTLGQAKPILDRPNFGYRDLQQAGTLALAEVTTSRATPSPDATSRRSLSTWLWITVEDKFDHVDTPPCFSPFTYYLAKSKMNPYQKKTSTQLTHGKLCCSHSTRAVLCSVMNKDRSE